MESNRNNDEDCCKIIDSSPEMINLLSDDSSDVIILNDPIERTVMICSNSDDDSFKDIHINIDNRKENDSDGNVSDVETGISVNWDWNKVESPEGWTKSMKRYYNKPCKRQKYFDWKNILSEIRSGPSSKWSIIDDDRYSTPTRKKKCKTCNQIGHLARWCPRREKLCRMCGVTGHLYFRCPERKCLNCGIRAETFSSSCRQCRYEKSMKCQGCKRRGHDFRNCPDLWRQFHCTIESAGGINCTPAKLNENMQCSNCANVGHLYEDCKEIYWSSFPPTSCIVGKYYKDNDSITHNNNISTQHKHNKSSKRNYISENQSSIDNDNPSSSKKLKFTESNGSLKPAFKNPFSSFLSMFPKKKKKKYRRRKKEKQIVNN